MAGVGAGVDSFLAMGTRPAALVIADDHALVHDGIRQFLDREDDLRMVGEAARQLGGRLEVDSAPAAGTRIGIWVQAV